jgi:hypothetical protein
VPIYNEIRLGAGIKNYPFIFHVEINTQFLLADTGDSRYTRFCMSAVLLQNINRVNILSAAKAEAAEQAH